MLYSYINYINLLPWLIIFQVLMFADCLLNRSIKGLSKGKWFLVMFLLQGLGAFVYFAFAPSLLFTSILNLIVSFRKNATAAQARFQQYQLKHQPSQPKTSEPLSDYSQGYPSQTPPPSEQPPLPAYPAHESPQAIYPPNEILPPPPEQSSKM